MSDQPNPHWTEGLLSTPFSLFQVGPEVLFQDAGQENDANEHVDVNPNELPDVNAGQVDAIDTPESRQAYPAHERDALDAVETQPVGQLKDIGDTSLTEGPIEPATPLSEIKSPNELADVNAGKVDAIDVISNEHADVNEDEHADGPLIAAET
ncbi:unnamed protein product [Arabis nemorensis]|uniref:Uncharacterized protein n=1 Tax=Arabis nemorensis TaxID=586526 RepID=A0A565CLK5_9BRAS|nr:unnamed protein product [Arabis nemorensis]